MLRALLAGCHGRMGQEFFRSCIGSDISITAGIDYRNRSTDGFPVFSHANQSIPPCDILVDFSHPEALDSLLDFCKDRNMPVLLAVTGYSKQQIGKIEMAAETIPVFRSPNLSIGASIMLLLTEYAASLAMSDFDISIIERHHRTKLDAPSGTALALSEKLLSPATILSIRAGTTAGEHQVLFTGNNEVLELTHRADTRAVYAEGALQAVRFMAKIKDPGLYGMQHLLFQNRFSAHM